MIRSVAIVDLWTDENRGDAALQSSLVRIIRERFPDALLIGIYRFGFNEIAALSDETEVTRPLLDEHLGGPRITFLGGTTRVWQRSTILRLIMNAYSTLRFAWSTLCYRALRRWSRALMSRHEHAVFRALDAASLVVWKGKNFREYGDRTTLTRALSLTLNILPAIALRKRIVCINASFWEIRQPMAALYYRSIAARCEAVVVRERDSLANVRKLLPDHPGITIAPDLSFKLLGEIYEGKRTAFQSLNDRPVRAAITVTEWGSGDSRAKYVRAISCALRRLEALGWHDAVIVPQVVRQRESNAKIVADIVAASNLRSMSIRTLDERMSIEDLVDFYATCRLLIATRMHSCVFARTARTPFIAVAYDEGSKWSILAEFWPNEFIHPFSTLDPDAFADQVAKIPERGTALIAGSEAKFLDLIASVDDNIPATMCR
jgi:colanic acid/amylovoran biosynthesis protein